MFGLSFTTKDVVRAIWTFAFTWIATFFTLSSGWGPINNLADLKAAAWALAPACLAAAFSAAKNAVLADGTTLKG
jgi:hypothetical protein